MHLLRERSFENNRKANTSQMHVLFSDNEVSIVVATKDGFVQTANLKSRCCQMLYKCKALIGQRFRYLF